jgi:hypothetical protein
MPEAGGSNIEVAHHLSAARKAPTQSLAHESLEIVEAIVLAIVAIATAWSGYQAALWNGIQSELYGQSTRLRVQAEGVLLIANEERVYNAATVVEWLKAEARGEKKLAELFERRLLPEIRPTFEAWKKTDPINDPQAPAGPYFMPGFRAHGTEESALLNDKATQAFERGNEARRYSDDYVRVTVTLATVLLLTAISQRFRIHAVRVGLTVLAALILLHPIFRIVTLPQA